MKLTENKILSAVCSGFSAASFILPFSLAMAACTDLGIYAGIIGAFIAAAISFAGRKASLAPSLTAFIILIGLSDSFGAGAAFAATALAGIISLIAFFIKSKFGKDKPITISPAVAGAISLAQAHVITVLITTDYFGIGAVGATVREMLASYRSLGFHANWRGVLYGTIVMVVMITFPRKFKSFSKKISAASLAVIITLVLNLFLNPDAKTTAIKEVGSYSLLPTQLFSGAFFAGFDTKAILPVILAAASLSLVGIYIHSGSGNGNADNRDILVYSSSLLLSGVSGGVASLTSRRERTTVSSSLIAAAIVLAISLGLHALVARIPIPSLAVVLIVGAWQTVDWSQLKKAFTDGAVSIIVFIICIALMLFADIPLAIVLCIILGRNFK